MVGALVAAGTGTDVMAGGAGAAGPAPDVWHQPQGIRGVRGLILGYPKQISGYPKKHNT